MQPLAHPRALQNLALLTSTLPSPTLRLRSLRYNDLDDEAKRVLTDAAKQRSAPLDLEL